MPDQPRKLIVCCDGTWNKPDQEGGPTNVVKLARAIRPENDAGGTQIVYYHPGVGTGNAVDRFMGGTLGIGLSANVQACYDFLATNFQRGDKIYLFGFSRGAYTARSLAGLIGKVGGLLKKTDLDLFPYVFDIYRSVAHRDALGSGNKDQIEAALRALFSPDRLGKNFDRLTKAILETRSTRIFFIGVWDTVGALGVPAGPLRWIGQSKYNFHDTELSERVRFAYHALAIDETRKNFTPSLWTRRKGRGTDANARPQTLEQVWFAGAHSNVGGGYADCGLSDIAFLWMVDKAASARGDANDPDPPLAFDTEYLKTKIVSTLGLLVNSRKGIWQALPAYQRPVLAPPPPDPKTGEEKETCESIHWSVRFRFQCTDDKLFSPYPYQPVTLREALEKEGSVADLSPFERQYRRWPDVAAAGATSGKDPGAAAAGRAVSG